MYYFKEIFLVFKIFTLIIVNLPTYFFISVDNILEIMSDIFSCLSNNNCSQLKIKNELECLMLNEESDFFVFLLFS